MRNFKDAGRAQRSAHLVQPFNLTGTARVANLVRREDRRRQSAGWRKTVQEVEASLGLNTERTQGVTPAKPARPNGPLRKEIPVLSFSLSTT